MNKEELIAYIESLDLPTEEYYILSSGCLVLYGIRDIAGDLDICVTPKLGRILMDRYGLTEDSKNEMNFYQINDKFEFVINEELSFEKLGKYQVQKLEEIVKFKKLRQKKRDLEDVANIEKYWAANKNEG